MKDFIKKGLGALIPGGEKVTDKNSPQYIKEKEQARSPDPKVRKKLASKKSTRPEILYYLAADSDPDVRRAVAQNVATPSQADVVLAKDGSVDVRIALAKRLMDLLPNLSDSKQAQLYSYAVNALGTLARDEVLKVRIALSTTLKDKTYTPPQVASQLARDAEQEVAEPMLRFCVALSDEDLLEIISGHPAPWVLTAIASRDVVNEAVSDAIIDIDELESSTALITNNGARIGQRSLEIIVEKAATIPQFQEPLVKRTSLPASLAAELAIFVDSSLLRYLEKRSDYDAKTREEIVSTVRRRIEFEERIGNKSELPKRIIELHKAGQLTEDIIGDAISWREHEFVKMSLALLAQVPQEVVDKIITTGAPKPIVALIWRAGLSMRMAIKVQQEMARIPQREVLLAKGGTDFPLDEKDMLWQLDFFGVKEPKKKLN